MLKKVMDYIYHILMIILCIAMILGVIGLMLKPYIPIFYKFLFGSILLLTIAYTVIGLALNVKKNKE